ncbi:Coiled-coil domain-containing protein 47 [Aphelenchoides fujianensis]|nr:Coiled-coil domain-containing protein 47 [Aphelenchoides fujianensis]
MRRLLLIFLLCALLVHSTVGSSKDDFSEFDTPEDFDVPAPPIQSSAKLDPTTPPAPVKEEVIFDEDEFMPLDEEENTEEALPSEKTDTKSAPKQEQKISPLTFADIPTHFRSNWSSYQVESVMLALIFIYSLNFIYGKSRNHSLANNWYAYSHPILEQNFALVGDDGTSQEATGGHMMKDTEYSYSIWSSGRAGVQGMLSQLKLLKRQDLVGIVINRFNPRSDKIVHRVELDPNEMDTFVMAFGVRKSLVKLAKDYTDLSSFTAEKKNVGQYGLPPNFTVYTEISECIPAILDQSMCQFIKKYERFIDYFHFSDQYCGQKLPDETVTKLPETTPTLVFSFNLLESEQDHELQQTLLQFMFHTIERIRRYRLSREGKAKADKKRRAVEESFLKNTHQQRQEAAQARREEKTRERKQRLLEEEDPEKQRRLQKIEAKKESKFKQPKVKQLRVK